MKLSGSPLNLHFTTTVELPRPGGGGPFLSLRPLPLGFPERLATRQITPPLPPVRVARDSQGRPLRQADGSAVLLPDEHDADFRRERDLYQRRLAVLSVVEALGDDDRIEFETRADSFSDDWRPFADRLHDELVRAGFTAGDLVWLCRQVMQLSNLLDSHLKESEARFFPAGPPTPV